MTAILPPDYDITEQSIAVNEYNILRDAVGWKDVNKEKSEKGLTNSLFSLCVSSVDKVIGCGRVVGDGAVYFYIQDVIVLPEFQKKGIGARIMYRIMDYLRVNAEPDAMIGLFAASGSAAFYNRFGFKQRPVDIPGMQMLNANWMFRKLF